MINRQSSLPLESIIRINLVGTVPKDCSFATSKDNSISTTFSVKLTDHVSKIFDLLGSPNRQARLIFNGQVLCPNLTFSFYNIHNNDKIVIVSSTTSVSASPSFGLPNAPLKDYNSQNQVLVAIPKPIPISHKRTQFYSTCSNLYKKYVTNATTSEDEKSQSQSDNKLTTGEPLRIPQPKTNPKPFRNYCSRYNSFATDNSSKNSQALFAPQESEELQEKMEENEAVENENISIN